MTHSLAAMRQEYGQQGLAEEQLAADWLAQFQSWLAQAQQAEIVEPNAMVVSTATPDGRPSSRTVLLKHVDAEGLVFFTNYDSRKARQALANPYVSAVFAWYPIARQVIVTGRIAKVDEQVSRDYFDQRPRFSQLSAWASPQSTIVTDRAELEERFEAVRLRFEGQEVPLPPHWGGMRISVESVEFWQGRQGRLHDRLRYRRDGAEWLIERLAP